MNALLLFVVFGSLGIVAEVFFTAIKKFIKTRDLMLDGYSLVWSFPIYGIAGLAGPVIELISERNILVRGIVYMALIFLVEYVAGLMTKRLIGKCPWEYKARFAVNGYIRLDYAPFWFLLGIAFETVYHLMV